jgi:hypothetical protein
VNHPGPGAPCRCPGRVGEAEDGRSLPVVAEAEIADAPLRRGAAARLKAEEARVEVEALRAGGGDRADVVDAEKLHPRIVY